MKDLTFIEEIPTITEKKLLNWCKMEQIYSIVDILARAKRQRYFIDTDEPLQEFLLSRPTMEEKEQYRVSKILEPAGQTLREVKIKGTYKTRERDREKKALKLRKSLRPSTSETSEASPLQSLNSPPFEIIVSQFPSELTRHLAQRVSSSVQSARINSLTHHLHACERIQKDILQIHLSLLYIPSRHDESLVRLSPYQITDTSVHLYRQQALLDTKQGIVDKLKLASEEFMTQQSARNQLLQQYLQQISDILSLLKHLSRQQDAPNNFANQLVLDFAKDQLRILLGLVKKVSETPLRIALVNTTSSLPPAKMERTRASITASSSFTPKTRSTTDRRKTATKNI